MAEVVLRDKLESLRRAMARIESHRAPSCGSRIELRAGVDHAPPLGLAV